MPSPERRFKQRPHPSTDAATPVTSRGRRRAATHGATPPPVTGGGQPGQPQDAARAEHPPIIDQGRSADLSTPALHSALPDPLAHAFLSELNQCSTTDRWAVLHAVRGAGAGYAGERVLLCLNALRVCAADLGRVSKNGYAQWRMGQPAPDEWPTTKYIEGTFRSWKNATAAAGHDVVLDIFTSHPGLNVRDPYTPDEIREALTEYGQTGGRLVWDDYLAWARGRMQRHDRRLRRYVRSLPKVREHFGSWTGALVAVGLGERMLAERGSKRLRHGAESDYTVERCHEVLRLAFSTERDRARLAGEPGRFLKERYSEWAAAYEAEEMAVGRWTAVPHHATICKVCTSWAAALYGAGLIDRRELKSQERRSTVRRSDAEMVAGLEEAMPADSSYMTMPQYSRYSDRRGCINGQWLPSSELIRRRLGWRQANRMACELRTRRSSTDTRR